MYIVTDGTATTTADGEITEPDEGKEGEAISEGELAGRNPWAKRTKKPSSRTFGPNWIN